MRQYAFPVWGAHWTSAYAASARCGRYTAGGLAFPAGGVVFDVGANIGMFSLMAGERMRGAGRIYAFEPVPAVFDCLRANAEAHSTGGLSIVALPCGLSDRPGEVTFDFHPAMSIWCGARVACVWSCVCRVVCVYVCAYA